MLGFLKDHKGELSMMRLQTLIVVITGCVYAFVHQDIAMTAMFFTFGFGGKGFQKHQELKSI